MLEEGHLRVVKELTAASSTTALTWFSNRIGSTRRSSARTRISAELIGTQVGDVRHRRGACHRACPIRPREWHGNCGEDCAVVGGSRKKVQSRAVFIFDLEDHAIGHSQRRQLGQKQPADRGTSPLALQHCWELASCVFSQSCRCWTSVVSLKLQSSY